MRWFKFMVVMLMIFLFVGTPFFTRNVSAESDEARLARLEEKIDSLNDKLDTYLTVSGKQDSRIGALEKTVIEHASKFGVITWLGGALWALVLIIIGQFVKRWSEPRKKEPINELQE